MQLYKITTIFHAREKFLCYVEARSEEDAYMQSQRKIGYYPRKALIFKKLDKLPEGAEIL